MIESAFPVPPSIIALFPLLLELVVRLLDQVGWAGETVILRLLSKDTRQVWKSLAAGQQTGVFELLGEYFRFGERADQIIRAHLAFLLSMYFVAVEHSKNFLEVKGWPVFGLAVVGISLVIFLLQLAHDRLQVAPKHQLLGWRIWFWVQLIPILGLQIWDHLR